MFRRFPLAFLNNSSIIYIYIYNINIFMELQINNHDNYVENANGYRKWYFKWLGFIMFGITITVLSFIVWKENAQAITIYPEYIAVYENSRPITNNNWPNMVFGTPATNYSTTTNLIIHNRYDNYWGYNYINTRSIIKFDLSEYEGNEIISAELHYTGGQTMNGATSTVNLFEFNKTYNNLDDFASFGNQALSDGKTYDGIGWGGSFGAGYFTLDHNGLIYLNDKLNNSSEEIYLGMRMSFDYQVQDPPNWDNGTWKVYEGIYLEIETTETYNPITIINPSPTQSREPILVNDFPEIVRITGTCVGEGSNQVLIHRRQYSFVPTEDDFDTPAEDLYISSCNSGFWWIDMEFWQITDISNSYIITAWSRDFLNNSRNPKNGYDNKTVNITLETILSFDPEALLGIDIPSDSQYTCANLPPFFEVTGTAPFFQINEFQKRISCIFIDENFNSNVEKMKHNQEIIYKNKIPFAYYYKIVDLWDNRSTTTNTKITLNLTDNPKIPTSSPLKNINYEFLDAENLQYENLPEGLKDVADFMEDRLVPVIFASFIIWLAIRVASSISS